MGDKCPDGLQSLLEKVQQADLPTALSSQASWLAGVDAWIAQAKPEEENGLWNYLWNRFESLAKDHAETPPALLLFLLCCCRSIYADKYHFKDPRNVLGDLLALCTGLKDALDKVGSHDARVCWEAAMNAAAAAVEGNARAHLSQLTQVVGKERWGFDGSTIVFGDLVEVSWANISQGKLADAEVCEQLRLLPASAEDPYSWEKLTSLIHDIAASRWECIGPQLQEKWFQQVVSPANAEDDPNDLLRFYPLARRDPNWLHMARGGLEDSLRAKRSRGLDFLRKRLGQWCRSLVSFEAPSCDGGRVLLDVLSDHDPDSDNCEFFKVILDHAWEVYRRQDVGFLLCLIWHEYRLWQFQRGEVQWSEKTSERWKKTRDKARSSSDEELLLWLVERLYELPREEYYTRRAADLFGPEERAAWRSDLIQKLRRKGTLRRCAVEFLLWCASGRAADDAELAAAALLGAKRDRTYLRSLYLNHPSRKVQLRARAVDTLLQGGQGPVLLDVNRNGVRSLSATLVALRQQGEQPGDGRTWIGDHIVEDLIYGAISRAERTFAEQYPNEWGHEEERLVTRLLSSMETECNRVRVLLREAVAQGLGTPVDIELKYRETTKHEEGQPGVGTKRFSVDIAFLVRVEAQGLVETERASFVQVKKLEQGRGKATWRDSFDIDPVQRDELLEQTESSFYLFLTPVFAREECWTVPARLVRSMMEAAKAKTRLDRFAAGRASKSLARWLTFDVVGLWTGDERSEIVRKAKGDHPGRQPRFLVSITIRKGAGEQG